MAKSTSTSLWRPANALAALGLLVLRVLAKCPLSWSLGIGKFLGLIVYIVFPYRKQVALTNLRLCYPDMPEKDRVRLVREHYKAMGMGIFELGAAWYKDPADVYKISEVTGLENLEAVARSGRGALLMTAHFTTLEIVGRIILGKYKISCLYREPDQPVIGRAMSRIRATEMRNVIHQDNIKEMIRALRRGEMIWYTPDQGKRIKYSEVLPFFGVPAVTNTATSRIARLGRAAIVPFVGYRLPNGAYRVEFLPELENLPSKDPEADSIIFNKVIEDLISRAPEQYFWLHKRFKRRGPGYEDVYAR